jgi:phosphatidylglycerophosphate synthase
MTWANGVTLVRIGLIPVIVFYLNAEPAWLFFLLLALVLIGDLLDGALARWQGQITELGKALDPLADKLLFAALFIALAARGDLSAWAVLLWAIPQLGLLIGGAALFHGWKQVVAARWSGKLATIVLSIGLLALLIEARLSIDLPLAREITFVGIFLSYLAGVDYWRNALRLVRQQTESQTQEAKEP